MDVVKMKLENWMWDEDYPQDKVEEKEEENDEEKEPDAEPTRRLSNPQDSLKSAKPLKDSIDAKVQHKKIRNRDGLELNTLVIPGKPGSKVMLLCSPLGFSNIYVFRPLIAEFGDEYTYVNWQYRSLFESDSPNRLRRCSVRDHAEDALDVLKGSGFSHADVIVGHSMGVSVQTEFVLLYPEHVSSLIMINGGHGHLFSTAFQPFLRLPFMGNVSEFVVKTLLENNPKRTMEIIKKVSSSKPFKRVLEAFGKATGTPLIQEVHGHQFWNEWFDMYFGGLSKDDKSAASYCRLFQELHAHSTYHLLHEIEHPVLLVSGGLDYLTPAYLMNEMANQMKNATYFCDTWSTHMTLLEHPEAVIEQSRKFLGELASGRYERTGSTVFIRNN